MEKQTNILLTGEVGNIGLKQLREQRELTTNKWAKFGLLEGLEGHMKENIAQLFENQASFMINESTTSDSSGAFETVAFPIIRRVFSKLIANELVSVQALNMPIGRIYFINPKISTRSADGRHSVMDGVYSNAANNYTLDSDLRRTGKPSGTTYESTSLYDSYYATEYDDYGTALHDRTNGRIAVASGATSITTSITVGTTKFAHGSITGFSTTNRGKLVGPIGIPADTDEFLSTLKIVSNATFVNSTDSSVTIAPGSPIPFRVKAQPYAQSIVDASGNIAIEIDLQTPNASTGEYMAFSSATAASAITFTYSYNVYSDLEEDAEIAEVTFDFDYITVDVGRPKMLRATYTPQVAQDVSAFHSIDVEAELTALLSETVSAETDRMILRDLRNGAAWKLRWDYKGYDKKVASGAVALTRKDYNQELITLVNQISAQIMKSTLRGGANWIVVSPEVAAVFNDLEYFHVSNADAEETKFSLGIEKIGSLQGRYTVYVDAYAPANTILMGHKGDSIFHSGYIYAPYTPLMLFPKLINPADFKTVLGIQTRFATKMVNNRFFGKIYVDNLTFFTVTEWL